MNESLALLLDEIQRMLGAGFLVFLRVGAVMALMPAFGEQTVPLRLRLALAIAFAVVVAPAVDVPVLSTSAVQIVRSAGPELVSGLFLGIVLRLWVLALQTAGSIAAQSTSLSQIFGGGAGEPQPAIGHLLGIGGLALAAAMGLHIKIAVYLIESYAILPAGSFPAAEAILTSGLAAVARTFGLGFTLAAPFVIAALIYNVTIGVINRAMPQLMVSFIGAPALTFGGLVMLVAAAPLLLGIWLDGFHALLDSPF